MKKSRLGFVLAFVVFMVVASPNVIGGVNEPPCIGVDKTCDPATLGQPTQFHISTVNCGLEPLNNVFVQDFNVQGPIAFGPFSLAPGAVTNLSGSYTADNCGTFTNFVFASAIGQFSGQLATNSTFALCPVTGGCTGCIDVSKQCDPVAFGQPTPFSITVTNCGDAVLTNVFVQDFNVQGPIAFGPFPLLVGGTTNLIGQYTADDCGTFTNFVFASGSTLITGELVTNSTFALCPVTGCATTNPAITCDVQFFLTNGVQIVTNECGTAAPIGIPTGTTVIGVLQICEGISGSVSEIVAQVVIDGVITNNCFTEFLSPGPCDSSFCNFFFTCGTPGVHTVAATVNAEANCAGCITTTCSAILECCPVCPLSIICPSNIVVATDAGQCSAAVTFDVTADDGGCSNIVSFTVDPPSGSTFPKGTTTVTATAINIFSNSVSCNFTVTVEDREAPLVACRPAPNPSGKKIPVAGKGGSNGQNPDGYYQLLAKDNCDPNPLLYVQDTGSAFRAGPFTNGAIVKLKQNPGGTPTSTPGNPPITAEIHLKVDALAIAVDAAGNETPSANGCLMLLPPNPK